MRDSTNHNLQKSVWEWALDDDRTPTAVTMANTVHRKAPVEYPSLHIETKSTECKSKILRKMESNEKELVANNLVIVIWKMSTLKSENVFPKWQKWLFISRLCHSWASNVGTASPQSYRKWGKRHLKTFPTRMRERMGCQGGCSAPSRLVCQVQGFSALS